MSYEVLKTRADRARLEIKRLKKGYEYDRHRDDWNTWVDSQKHVVDSITGEKVPKAIQNAKNELLATIEDIWNEINNPSETMTDTDEPFEKMLSESVLAEFAKAREQIREAETLGLDVKIITVIETAIAILVAIF